jgi:hypothetical protein
VHANPISQAQWYSAKIKSQNLNRQDTKIAKETAEDAMLDIA